MSYLNRFTQNVLADALNSSTANIAVGQAYSGSASSTLGVVGLQISLKTDQNCTVYVDQSPDGNNWDIVDTYNYSKVINNFGVTVQAINSYYRVRVKNVGLATTTEFRLQSALCPIVEAVPRSLDSEGNFKVCIQDWEDTGTGSRIWIGDFHELRANPVTRLIGTTFVGNTKDTNFWTESVTGTGTTTQASGSIILSTGTTLSSTVQYQTVRASRWVTGQENTFRTVLRMLDTGTVGNIRNAGAFNATDGFFFQSSGSVINVVSRRAGVDTAVPSVSWNVNNSFTRDTNFHSLEIKMTYLGVYFFIDGYLVHKLLPTTAFFSQTLNLPVTIQNINQGITDNISVEVGVAFISRTGPLDTAPTWKHITAATGTILKYGAGRLHKVVFNTFGNGATVTIYDALTATNVICVVAPPNGIFPGTVSYDLDFYTGLTITVTGTVDLTIVYE